MKKWVRNAGAGVTMALGLSMLVAGCATSGSGNSNDSKSSSGSVTLTIMGWNIAEQTLQKDADLYHKSHPNVNFKFVTMDSPTNAYTKLNTELASGSNVPDIMTIESEPAPSFINKFPKAFLDVTDKVQDIKSQFAPAKWVDLTMNNRIYGVPWDIGPTLLFYRTDMFKEAGIDPNSIKTWDDYIAAGKKLVQHFNGKVMMGPAGVGDDALMKMMLSEEGSGYFDANGNITVNSPAAVKALQTEEKMVKAGILKEVPQATGWKG
jgi:lactose/L-arabinose transport system substrate-binding protein